MSAPQRELTLCVSLRTVTAGDAESSSRCATKHGRLPSVLLNPSYLLGRRWLSPGTAQARANAGHKLVTFMRHRSSVRVATAIRIFLAMLVFYAALCALSILNGTIYDPQNGGFDPIVTVIDRTLRAAWNWLGWYDNRLLSSTEESPTIAWPASVNPLPRWLCVPHYVLTVMLVMVPPLVLALWTYGYSTRSGRSRCPRCGTTIDRLLGRHCRRCGVVPPTSVGPKMEGAPLAIEQFSHGGKATVSKIGMSTLVFLATLAGVLGLQYAARIYPGDILWEPWLAYADPRAHLTWCEARWAVESVSLGAVLWTVPLLLALLVYDRRTFGRFIADECQCPRCGYSLVGLSERRCPECGLPFHVSYP